MGLNPNDHESLEAFIEDPSGIGGNTQQPHSPLHLLPIQQDNPDVLTVPATLVPPDALDSNTLTVDAQPSGTASTHPIQGQPGVASTHPMPPLPMPMPAPAAAETGTDECSRILQRVKDALTSGEHMDATEKSEILDAIDAFLTKKFDPSALVAYIQRVQKWKVIDTR